VAVKLDLATARLQWETASSRCEGCFVATKYTGFVDLEYEIYPDDPMPGVIGSFAYMRGILAGLG